MSLMVPVWVSLSPAVPQRTAGYSPAQQGAAVSPTASKQAATIHQNAGKYRSTDTAAPPLQNQQQSFQPAIQSNQECSQQPSQTTNVTPQPQQTSKSGYKNSSTKTSVLVHRKIWTVGGNKKFIDFTDKLTLARVEDYANIHGIGGKEHNRNSVIGIAICDFTNGTGYGSSKTLRACLDVEDIDQLYEAAKQARLGKLKPESSLEINWMNTALRQMESWKQIPVAPDGTRAIPRGSLNSLFSIVSNAKAHLMPLVGAPFYSYYSEKNNPWKKNEQTGFAHCYSLTINYSPFMQSGEKSSYPWYIKIEEFDAPLIEQKNGSIAHKSSEATNKRYAFINLSCDDFWRSMVAVKRYIRNWEYHMTKPLFREAFQRLAAQREARDST